MKNILKQAKESARTLLEIFAQVPGSFSEYQTQIRNALRESPPTEIQGADYCYIEGVVGEFPQKVIFEAVWWDDKKETKYFQADVTLGENDKVLFSNITEVEIKAAVTAKNEMRKLEESDTAENKKMVELNETISATVTLEPFDEAMRGKKKRTGKVEIAQQSDVKNENGRVYPKPVLKEAVENAQEYLPLLMDSQHRVNANGEPESNLRETVALVKSIEFNEATGIVSLPEIEFVDTQAGKDLQELLDSGAKLNVSQRGIGSSHTVINQQTGDTHEEIDFLRIKGIDFVPRGQSGVADAAFESRSEGTKPEKANPSADELNLTVEGEIPKPPITALAGGGTQPPTNTNNGGNGGGAAPNTTANGSGDGGNDGGQSQPESVSLSPEDKALLEQNAQQSQQTAQVVNILDEQLRESQAALEESQKKQALAHLEQVGKEILEIEVAELTRFNADQKELVKQRINVKALYERITDVYNPDAVATVLKPEIAKQAQTIDETLATSKLGNMGFPVDQMTGMANGQQGKTRIEIVNESFPNAEMHHKVVEHVTTNLRKNMANDAWFMPEDHASMKDLAHVMNAFAHIHGSKLLQENTLSQADIGGRIATISAMVIPIAWRLITAFQVVDTEPMVTRILDKKIRKYTPKPVGEDVVTQYANLDPGEKGKIEKTKVSYGNFPIYSTRQALRSEITPEAIATAYNTPMQPMMDAVEAIALDIRQRIDMMLWWQYIAHGQRQNAQQVATFETLKQVGSTDTWEAANQGWIQHVWQKDVDAEGNPVSAKFVSLLPDAGASAAPTNLGLQGVELQTSANTAVALLYGTDYTVDFMNGKITLTAAGKTKVASDDVQAKYTYTQNINFWGATAPSGTTMMEHIHSLRRSVGKARVSITERNWEPNFVAFNVDTEDIITQGSRMTHLGGSPADLMDRMNEVIRYAGLDPIRTTAFPSQYGIVGQKGAVCHAVHIPWMFGAPLTDWETGIKYTLGEQWSGSDCPVSDKIALVGVTE